MNFLPFGYLWLIKRNLEKEKVKTILDLGCGTGAFGTFFNTDNRFKITGIEIYAPYIQISKRTKRYDKLINADLTKKLKFKNNAFDAVVSLQVIEHLSKESGQKLLTEAHRVAKKLIIITTPVGECSQEAYDDNIHQQHHSAWFPEEFIKAGFRVFGVGLKAVYGSHSHAQKKLSLFILPLAFLSFILNPLTNILPGIAAQMVAVKKLKIGRRIK